MKSLLIFLLSAQLSPAISIAWNPNPTNQQIVEYFVAFTVQGNPTSYYYSAGNNTRFLVPVPVTTRATFMVYAKNSVGQYSLASLYVRYTPNRGVESSTVFNVGASGVVGTFALTGDAGKPFSIQTSSNLQSWTDSYSGVIGQNDLFNYSFPVTADQRKFYRVAFLKF